jgi:hypothetical protein
MSEVGFLAGQKDGVEHEVDEKDPRSLGPALALVGKAVETTATPDDASLELTFSDGSRLHCASQARFEAWQVVGGSPQYLVVSVGSGDLHVYDDPKPQRLPRVP